MLCCKKYHIIACDALDEELCTKVAKSVFTDVNNRGMEGAVERWKCPTCGEEYVTILMDGRRVNYGPLRVGGEKEILCQHSSVGRAAHS